MALRVIPPKLKSHASQRTFREVCIAARWRPVRSKGSKGWDGSKAKDNFLFFRLPEGKNAGNGRVS